MPKYNFRTPFPKNSSGRLLLTIHYHYLWRALMKSKGILHTFFPSLIYQWDELDELESQKTKILYEDI